MKKKMVTLTAAVLIIFNTTFAQQENKGVNEKVIAAFSQQFPKSFDVSWELTDVYYKASFQSDGQFLFAFFAPDGDKMGVGRYLSPTNLPIELRSKLNKTYSGFWISELFENAADGQSKYYVTLENADQKILLESTGMYGWATYRRTNKS